MCDGWGQVLPTNAKYQLKNNNSSLNFNSHLKILHSLTKTTKRQSRGSASRLEDVLLTGCWTRLPRVLDVRGLRGELGLGAQSGAGIAPAVACRELVPSPWELDTPAPPDELEPPPTIKIKNKFQSLSWQLFATLNLVLVVLREMWITTLWLLGKLSFQLRNRFTQTT